MVAELAVLIAVRVRAQVLLPEQLQRHVLAAQSLTIVGNRSASCSHHAGRLHQAAPRPP